MSITYDFVVEISYGTRRILILRIISSLAPEEVEKFFSSEEARIRERFPAFEGAITVEQSVRDQLALISRITVDRSGDFVNRDGTNVEG